MMAFEWGCIRRIVLIFCGFVLAGSFSGCAFWPEGPGEDSRAVPGVGPAGR